MQKKAAIYIGLLTTLFSCSGLRKEKVDLIIHNATIYTVDDMSHVVEAMAIQGDSILDIGAEHEIMNRYQAKTVYDARKQFVYPGFIDAHCHFYGYAKTLSQVDLTGTTSWNDCLDRVQKFAEENPDLNWITGRGWDQNDWDEKEYPTNDELNQLFSDKPVLLRRIDGHAAIANQAALTIADISSETKIEGGAVLKSNNELTGILVDRAVDLVLNHIEELPESVLQSNLLRAQQSCFELGLTSLVDAGLTKPAIQKLEQLYQDSILSIRQYIMLSDDSATLAYYLPQGIIKTPNFHIESIKAYTDGALGSRGAALLSPYSDSPEESGMILFSEDHFRNLAKTAYENGFQLNSHCIGDSANRLMLDIYGEVLGGVNDRRWRIEHAQIVNPADLKKYQKFTVIPSVQPTHAISDMPWAVERLGEERLQQAYAYQSLLKQNFIIALGTDFPVEGIDPLQTFYTAVFRKDKNGEPVDGFLADEALSRDEALRGMTIWAALSQFEENQKGSLEKGKLADIVILNKDILKIPEGDFQNTKVVATFIGGKQVFPL